MSYDSLKTAIDTLTAQPQRGRRRRHKVMVSLSDDERSRLAAVAGALDRPLAEVVRGLALVAAAAVEGD